MSSFLVNKCVCQKLSFEVIKEYAIKNEISNVKQLQAKELCGTKCHMCLPYVQMVLETGKTAFEPGAYIDRNKSC